MRASTLFLVLISAPAVGCGDEVAPTNDGGARIVDSGTSRDAGVDASVDGGHAGLRPISPPPDPRFPDSIGTLSVAVRTGEGITAGTDDPIELCLNETTCFELDTPDVDDRQVGLVDAFHFGDLALPRSEVDGVTLRTRSPATSDNDRWTPACLELRFDGEPVYCNDALDLHIGTGDSTDEIPSFTDPEGLHQSCATCWPGTLTHGPVQGAHETDSVRVWVRADATRRVGIRMSEGTLDDSSPLVAWALPAPENDFSTVLTVSGLAPSQTYEYRIEVDGDTSQPVRRLQTAPEADDTEPVRIAFGSCSRLTSQPAFEPLLGEEPDLFLFLGDIHYANSRHQAAHRWHYRRFRGVAERAELLSQVPTLASWDDHDFVGNNSTGTCAGREEALRSFGEYWANPPAGTTETQGVFFRHRWGAVELFALDCRMHRPDVGDSGRRCEDDPSPPTLSVEDGPIGAAQLTWLLDSLDSSDAVFKLISCGSQFTLEGSRDSWASFEGARRSLFDALSERRIEGVVLLSGDIHRSEVRLISRPSSYDLPELSSSPIANTVSICRGDTEERQFCFDSGPSYIVLDADPGASDPTLTVRVHDAWGTMRYENTIQRSDLQEP